MGTHRISEAADFGKLVVATTAVAAEGLVDVTGKLTVVEVGQGHFLHVHERQVSLKMYQVA